MKVMKKFAYELDVLDTALFTTICLEATCSALASRPDLDCVKCLRCVVKHVLNT